MRREHSLNTFLYFLKTLVNREPCAGDESLLPSHIVSTAAGLNTGGNSGQMEQPSGVDLE